MLWLLTGSKLDRQVLPLLVKGRRLRPHRCLACFGMRGGVRAVAIRGWFEAASQTAFG